MAFFRRKSESSIPRTTSSLPQLPQLPSLPSLPQLPSLPSLPQLPQKTVQPEPDSSGYTEDAQEPEEEKLMAVEMAAQCEAEASDLIELSHKSDLEATAVPELQKVEIVITENSKVLKVDPAEEAYKTPKKPYKSFFAERKAESIHELADRSQDKEDQAQESTTEHIQQPEAKGSPLKEKTEDNDDPTDNPVISVVIDSIATVAAFILIAYFILSDLIRLLLKILSEILEEFNTQRTRMRNKQYRSYMDEYYSVNSERARRAEAIRHAQSPTIKRHPVIAYIRSSLCMDSFKALKT